VLKISAEMQFINYIQNQKQQVLSEGNIALENPARRMTKDRCITQSWTTGYISFNNFYCVTIWQSCFIIARKDKTWGNLKQIPFLRKTTLTEIFVIFEAVIY